MNQKLLLMLVFLNFCLSSFSQAQSGWFFQESGTMYDLKSVSFVNTSTGYIAGGRTDPGPPYSSVNVFLKTTNGGLNWIPITSLIFGATDLFATRFWDANTGYIVTREVLYDPPIWPTTIRILKTIDGGINFISYIFPLNFPDLNFIYLTGTESGYIAGDAGRVIKISSTGYNVKVTGYSNDLYSTYFFNMTTGFAVGYGGLIVKTTNGGDNWTSITSGTTNELRSIFFATNTIGYIAGRYGTFLKTTSSGNNWFSLPTGNSYSYWSVCFTSIDTGYISSNVIYKTINGGINWETQTVPSSVPLNSICFAGLDTGFVAGNSGVILKTVTGGTTDIAKVSNEIPNEFVLFQNFPNPFNPTTTIKFSIPQKGLVKLVVYDMLGKEVATLVNDEQTAGNYEVTFDASKLTTGVYFYKITSGDFSDVKKMILVK